jgi:hypothetical protein
MNTRHTQDNFWGVRSFRAPTLWLGVLGILTAATACDEGAFAMVQSHLITTDSEPPSGYTCSQLSGSGSTSSGGNDGDFWITESQDADGVVVEWGEGDNRLGLREFPAEFFEAGKMDRFIIEAPNGDRFSYMAWGAESCTACPEQAFTPLPGDMFGCGNAVDAGATNVNGKGGQIGANVQDNVQDNE